MESATSQGSPEKSGKKVQSLRLVSRREAGPAFEPVDLKPGVMYVGRTDGNDVPLPSELVSRRHAKLIFTDMGLTVHDLDSHNGVFLNGKKVRSTPVKPGDFLYFADICCKVEEGEPGENADAFSVESSMNKSSLVSQVLKGEQANDPAVRNLATLIQATDLLLSADDDSFYPEMLSRCRDLTEATLAVLVREQEDGTLLTPVVLREGTAPRSEPPVSWPVVEQAMREGIVLFSKDTAADPLIGPEQAASGEIGALMCVPIHIEGRARAAIYLGRPFAGEGFTDREVETISAVAHLVGIRIRGVTRGGEGTQVRKGTGDLSTSEESEHLLKLEQQSDRLKKEVIDLESQLTTQATQAKVQQEANHELTQRISGMQSENQRLAGEVTRLTSDQQQKSQADGAAAQKITELEARMEAQLAEIAAARNDSASAREELAKTKREAGRATEEAQRAAGEFSKLNAKLDDQLTRNESLELELSEARETLAKQAAGIKPDALIASTSALPPRVARRVVAIATGQPAPDEFGAGATVALCIGLAGFDSWADQAGAAEAKARLDVFCEAVHEAATARDGTLEQLLGHAHLITFPGDARGVQSALECARQVLESVPRDAATGVQGGVHVGTAGVGFFGGHSPVYAQFGEAIAIARGACEYARAGVVFVTSPVKDALPEELQASLFNVGPHLLRGFESPFQFFQFGPLSA